MLKSSDLILYQLPPLYHKLSLFTANHQASIFDLAVSGIVQPNTESLSSETLAEICRVLKPSGQLYMGHIIIGASSDENKQSATEQITSALKLSGFVNVLEVITEQHTNVICWSLLNFSNSYVSRKGRCVFFPILNVNDMKISNSMGIMVGHIPKLQSTHHANRFDVLFGSFYSVKDKSFLWLGVQQTMILH